MWCDLPKPNRENLTLRDSPLVRSIGPIHLAIAAVEAWVGAFYTTVFVLLIGIPVILGAIISPFEDEFGPKWAVAMLVVAVLWCALDVPLTLKTWRCVRDGETHPERQEEPESSEQGDAATGQERHQMKALRDRVLPPVSAETFSPCQYDGRRPIPAYVSGITALLAPTSAS